MEGYLMQIKGYQVFVDEQEEQDKLTYVENTEETERKEEEILFFDDFDFNEGYLMLYD